MLENCLWSWGKSERDRTSVFMGEAKGEKQRGEGSRLFDALEVFL
jgi:hypothetical protein